MSDRIRIAFFVWLVTLAFVGVATFAGFIIFLLGTGFANPKPVLSYVTLTVLPFLATAFPTKVLSAYVSRASNGASHAGPMVLGLAAGFVAGSAVGLALDTGMAFILAAIVVGPIIGATLATLVKLRVPPVAAGAVSAVLGLIFTYTATNP